MAFAFKDLSFPNREPDHILGTDLPTTSGSQTGWLHLYLPKREDEPCFFEVVGDVKEFSLDDTVRWVELGGKGSLSLDGRGFINASIPRFVWLERSSSPFAPGRSRTRLRGVALELHIRRDWSYVGVESTGAPRDTTRHTTYTLSGNSHLAPVTPWTHHFDGQRTFNQKTCVEVSLSEVSRLRFDTHYAWIGDKEKTCCPRLVATQEGAANSAIQEGISPTVEDAVLLLSFLTAVRTVVSHVSVWEGATQYEYIRPRFEFPDASTNGRFRFGLVALNCLETHFTTAWARWQATSDVASLRNATYALFPGTNVVTPMGFLQCFGAIEILIKAFAPANEERKKTASSSTHAKNLKQLRSRIEATEEAEIIKSLGAAITRFSEPTFQDYFTTFCQHFQVPLDDLWPMFAPRRGLAFLRNRLTHSSTFEESEEAALALFVAQQHLEFTLIRVMCAVLGIPLVETEARPGLHTSDLMFVKYQDALATVAGSPPTSPATKP
jgi:hypothetical protein